MSTLRVSNIEAKADPSSSTVDEQVKITNSNGDVLLYVDGRTSGITTVGINTTAQSFQVDSNNNFNFTGIVTATSLSGPIDASTGSFSGDVTVSGNLGVAGTITYEDVTRVDATGISTFREGIFLPDTKELKLGNTAASPDFTIKHDGSNAIISNSTGDVNITSDVNITGIITAVGGNSTEGAFLSGNAVGVGTTTTAGRNAGVSTATGTLIYNTSSKSLEFFTGTDWLATNLAPTLNSVTGEIYNSVSGRTLVISGNDITSNVDIRYSNNSNSAIIATDSSPTISGTNITSTIPAAVYGSSVGTVIRIEIINQDGAISSNSINETVLSAPTGGTITTAGGYRYHTFTSSGTFGNTIANLSVAYLVVAGGGGGGGNQGGGAGGAGGYRTGTATLGTGNLTATIGAGGANGGNGNGNLGTDGGNSTFNSLTSTGGGGGAGMNTGTQTVNGRNGGSGGGASHWMNGNATGGSGTSGQGNDGGNALDTENLGHNGGGGGGASADGTHGQNATGGNGGAGTAWLNGTTYAGGGGGGCYYDDKSGGSGTYSGGTPGSGGGGRGSRNEGTQNLSTTYDASTSSTQHGVDGKGGGGGGGGALPGDGGDGVVIIRYQL